MPEADISICLRNRAADRRQQVSVREVTLIKGKTGITLRYYSAKSNDTEKFNNQCALIFSQNSIMKRLIRLCLQFAGPCPAHLGGTHKMYSAL